MYKYLEVLGLKTDTPDAGHRIRYGSISIDAINDNRECYSTWRSLFALSADQEITTHAGDWARCDGIDRSVSICAEGSSRPGEHRPWYSWGFPITSSGVKTERAFSLVGTSIRARCGVKTSGVPTMPSTGVRSARHFSDSLGQKAGSNTECYPDFAMNIAR